MSVNNPDYASVYKYESAHKVVEICPSILVFGNEKLDYIETLSTEREQAKLSKGVTFYCDEQVTSESFTISFGIMFGEHVTGDSRQRLIKIGSLCEVMIGCSNMILVILQEIMAVLAFSKDLEMQRYSGLKLGEWNKIELCFEKSVNRVRVGVNGILTISIQDQKFQDEDLQPYTLGGHSSFVVEKGKDHHKSRHLFHGLIKKLQMQNGIMEFNESDLSKSQLINSLRDQHEKLVFIQSLTELENFNCGEHKLHRCTVPFVPRIKTVRPFYPLYKNKNIITETEFEAATGIQTLNLIIFLELVRGSNSMFEFQNIQTFCRKRLEISILNPKVGFIQDTYKLIGYNKSALVSFKI